MDDPEPDGLVLGFHLLRFLQDHDFFQHLEMHMRSEFPPLCGRDHLSFRSYYFPVKVGGSGEGAGCFRTDPDFL